jgi:hypothetical protein
MASFEIPYALESQYNHGTDEIDAFRLELPKEDFQCLQSVTTRR